MISLQTLYRVLPDGQTQACCHKHTRYKFAVRCPEAYPDADIYEVVYRIRLDPRPIVRSALDRTQENPNV